MMRLIDADAAADLLERTAEFYRNEGHDTFAMNLFSDAVMLRDPGCFPTVDAVEVVRCKDCKHRGNGYVCPFRQLLHTEAAGYHYIDKTTDDGFCSFGVRREAGT